MMTAKAKEGVAGFDISDLVSDDEAGADMHLCHPGTGEPLYDGEVPITIKLTSKDSQQYRNAQRLITDRRLSKRSGAKLTAERLESEANEILARCTVGWSGIKFQGEKLDCNYQNAKKIYDSLPWVKEQVDEFVADRSNFLGS